MTGKRWITMTVCASLLAQVSADGSQEPSAPPDSRDSNRTAGHVADLPVAPAALGSDRHGRLFVAIPSEAGGLFVVEAGQLRRVLAGDVSGLALSRDEKLFVAHESSVLELDLAEAWAIADVTERFGCSGEATRRPSASRDGSVWSEGCQRFRESNGVYDEVPGGLADGPSPIPADYDMHDNHWSIGDGADGATGVAIRTANAPQVWQRAEPQPEGDGWRLLSADAERSIWVAGDAGLRRLDPHQPAAGWRVPAGAEDLPGTITALSRSPDDMALAGFDTGALVELDADTANVLFTRTLLEPGSAGAIELIHSDPLGGIWFTSGMRLLRMEPAPDAWQHQWESVGPLPGGNHDIVAVELDDFLYVAGGLTVGWGYPAQRRIFDELVRYDPTTNSWGVASRMPAPVCHSGLTVLEGNIWVIGGRADLTDREGTYDLVPLDEVAVFDPATGTWRSGPRLNTPRTEVVALTAKGRVYAIGGAHRGLGEEALSSVETIGPGESAWRFAPELPRPIRQAAGCVLDDVIYVICVEGFFALDPERGAWEELPPPPHLPPTPYVTAYEGEVWVLGDHMTRKSWRYSPDERRWRPGPDLPTENSWGGAAVLNGRLHVVGGAHWSERQDVHIFDERAFALRKDWAARLLNDTRFAEGR